jgi:hypothetical protein
MHENGLVAIGFIGTVLGFAIAVWVNIALVKARLGKWDANSSIWFGMSVGNFGEKQRAMWLRRAGYNRGEAELFIRYQMLCLLETLLSFLASAVLITFLGP